MYPPNYLMAPQGGTYYQWFINGDTISGADGIDHYAIASGTYQVFFIDSNECIVNTELFNFYLPGIPVIYQPISINIHPNPNEGTFLIRTNSAGLFTIYNCLGLVMESFEMKSGEMELHLEHLPPGIYFIKIQAGNKTGLGKLVLIGE